MQESVKEVEIRLVLRLYKENLCSYRIVYKEKFCSYLVIYKVFVLTELFQVFTDLMNTGNRIISSNCEQLLSLRSINTFG